MKDLFERFKIKIEREEVQERFKKKVKNLLIYSEYCKVFDEEKMKFDIVWIIANDFGFSYIPHFYTEDKYRLIFPQNLCFEEYLARLQCLIDTLWKYSKTKHLSLKLAHSIQYTIDDLPVKLGIKIVFYKRKPPQIYPAKVKLLDDKVEEVLGVLESENYPEVLEQFEEGLKEFLNAKAKQQLKDAVEDMLGTCDLLMHSLFNNKNIGFKHLFDKKRLEQIGSNVYQKQILWQLKEWMDKIKHGVIKNYSKDDVEQIIYLTALTIHLLISKHANKTY